MAKGSLLNRDSVKLSGGDKVRAMAYKQAISDLTRLDASDLTLLRETREKIFRVIFQEGDGKGIRIRGAKTHTAADQLTALADNLRNGQIVQFDGSAKPNKEEETAA